MMANFVAIPSVPTTGVSYPEYRLITAMVQNVDLLTGSTTDGTTASKALLTSTYNMNIALPPARIVTIGTYPTYGLAGYAIPGGAGALYDGQGTSFQTSIRDGVYASDIQKMIDQITTLRLIVNSIIEQMVS
jgi:hypothetical protein